FVELLARTRDLGHHLVALLGEEPADASGADLVGPHDASVGATLGPHPLEQGLEIGTVKLQQGWQGSPLLSFRAAAGGAARRRTRRAAGGLPCARGAEPRDAAARRTP